MRSTNLKRDRYVGAVAPILIFGAFIFAAMAAFAPAPASAHFMITPPSKPPKPDTVQSWMSEDSVGGPQKNGPCAAVPNTALGDSPGTPVPNSVTLVKAGQTVIIPITVTVAHPGWFRVALVEGPSSSQTLATLADPVAQTGLPSKSVCTPAIMTNPKWSTTQPILADGLPAGSTATTTQSGTKMLQVTIPTTASCTSAKPCTLQVIMVMTDHPATDCYYHHCADVAVESGPTDGGASGGFDGAPPTGGTSGGATGGMSGGASGGSSGGAGHSAGGAFGVGGTSAGGSLGSGGGVDTGAAGSGNSTGAAGISGSGTGGETATGGTSVVSTTGAGGQSGVAGQTGGTTTGAGGTSGVAAQTGGTTTGAGGSSTGSGTSGGSSGLSCAVGGGRSPWALSAAGLLALVVLTTRRRRRR